MLAHTHTNPGLLDPALAGVGRRRPDPNATTTYPKHTHIHTHTDTHTRTFRGLYELLPCGGELLFGLGSLRPRRAQRLAQALRGSKAVSVGSDGRVRIDSACVDSMCDGGARRWEGVICCPVAAHLILILEGGGAGRVQRHVLLQLCHLQQQALVPA
jgi:hypothetical protein